MGEIRDILFTKSYSWQKTQIDIVFIVKCSALFVPESNWQSIQFCIFCLIVFLAKDFCFFDAARITICYLHLQKQKRK